MILKSIIKLYKRARQNSKYFIEIIKHIRLVLSQFMSPVPMYLKVLSNIMYFGYLCFPAPGPNLYLAALALQLYLPALARIENNKSQRLHSMLLSLFLTVIVDRSETKSNLSKKQINK